MRFTAFFDHRPRMAGICVVCLLYAGNWLLASRCVKAEEPKGDSHPISYAEMRSRCGPRSIWAWLRLLGHEVDYKDIADLIPVTSNGASLAQLTTVARRWVPTATPVKASISDLSELPLPFIAHGTLGRALQHYVVVVKVSSDQVVYIDAAQQLEVHAARSEFERGFWTGYALLAEPPRGWFGDYWTLASFAGVAFAVCALFWRKAAPASTVTLILVCTLITGCNQRSIETLGAGLPTPLGREPLAFSATKHDLGVIRLNEASKARFKISNISERPVELKIGSSSCGCLGASLDKQQLGPAEMAELTLVLSRGKDGSSVKGGGRVNVILLGNPERSYEFEAVALQEGMHADSYSLRFPTDQTNFSPPSIRGEVVLGPARDDAVVIVSKPVLDAKEGAMITLGSPILGELEPVDGHLRRQFEIPVAKAEGTMLKPQVYELQLPYSIDGRSADFYLQVLIFPEVAAR